MALRSSLRGKKTQGLRVEDLSQAVLLLGQPGMGQEGLLFNLLVQELVAGQRFALLDSEGSFLPELLDYASRSQINKLAYLDFADRSFPVRYNLLGKAPFEQRVKVKEGLLMALRALFGDSWGPRLEYILSYTLMALLEYSGSTLLSVQEFLADPWYRADVLKGVKDPFVRYFFLAEFSQYSERFRQEAIAPIQNKVGQFLLDPGLRLLLCQPGNKVRISTLLSQGMPLLCRLPQAEMGAPACKLLGITLLVKLLQAASDGFQGDDLVSVYVPDLHRFQSPGLASLLEDTLQRKVRLIVSLPSLLAVEAQVRAVLLTHFRQILAFRLGHEDARLFAKEFEPDFGYTDFVNLGPRQFIFKPLEQGYPVRPYSQGDAPLAPGKPRKSHREKIIKVSRERYAIPKEVLEDKLERHLRGVLERLKGQGGER